MHVRWRPFGAAGPSWAELARQAWSSTDRGYDLLARRFDATPFRTPDALIAAAFDALDRDARDARGVDLCCGTGAALAQLASRCLRVTGVDRSARMLEVARARVPSAMLVQGDVLALPADFTDSFDVACSFGAFGHIREHDEPRLVREVHRVLRRGGRFVFVTAMPPAPLSRRHIAARAFNAAMHARNAAGALVGRAPFVMFYLTFLLQRARALLEAAGFDVDVHPLALTTRDELGVHEGLVTVVARKS